MCDAARREVRKACSYDEVYTRSQVEQLQRVRVTFLLFLLADILGLRRVRQ